MAESNRNQILEAAIDALAKTAEEAMLFKGADYEHTDVASALTPRQES